MFLYTLNAIMQTLVFTLIPFLFYLVKYRKVKGFLPWLGLAPGNHKIGFLKASIYVVITILLSLFLILIKSRAEVINGEAMAVSVFKEMGPTLQGFYALFIMAFFQNALAEEILFRGFIAKRLINALGYVKGSVLQTLIFMSVHVQVLFFWRLPVALTAFIIVGIMGYFMGRITVKEGRGSLWPAIVIHFIANFLSYSLDLLLL